MAKKKKVVRSGATAFVRDFLGQNPQATGKEIEAAWRKAGHKAPFHQSMVYKIKGDLGLSSKRRKKRRKKAVAVEAAPAAAADPNVQFLAIEKSLDALIAKAEGLKDARLAEALRAARRRAGAKLV